jgi:hypothetical protein
LRCLQNLSRPLLPASGSINRSSAPPWQASASLRISPGGSDAAKTVQCKDPSLRSGFPLRAPARLRPRSRPQIGLIWGCRFADFFGSPVHGCTTIGLAHSRNSFGSYQPSAGICHRSAFPAGRDLQSCNPWCSDLATQTSLLLRLWRAAPCFFCLSRLRREITGSATRNNPPPYKQPLSSAA